MFKKGFSGSSKTKVKSSVQRHLRAKLLEQYPLLEPHIEEIFPKKSDLELIKAPDRLSLYAIGHEILFFQHFDDTIFPHLKLVHKFPECFPKLQVDRGAIRFILDGAQLMCPGLTSPGARLPPAEEAVPAGKVVVIMAEGKENACMIGRTKLSTEDIKKINKGVGVETFHVLGDGLWGLTAD
ncbi:PUA-like domain-containing protein [Peziza echinospora]|nr:PUA-like domain-containing protein [Peziza echinospora]